MATVPDGYVALDFVGFTDKGSYSATETYMQNDLVHKDNNVWRCLIDNIVGVTPVEGDIWTIFIKAPSGVNIATDNTPGTVMGNPDEIIIDTDGMMSISSSFTEQANLSEISGTETKKTFFGKIAYAINTLIEHIADTTIHSNTKNTAGSTNSSSKLFLVGAKSQSANPQTYSHDTAYIGTDGCLYSNNTKTSVEGHGHKSTDITFADDNNAETKVGSINGITDSLTATSSNVALSAAGGNNLQTQIDETNSSLSKYLEIPESKMQITYTSNVVSSTAKFDFKCDTKSRISSIYTHFEMNVALSANIFKQVCNFSGGGYPARNKMTVPLIVMTSTSVPIGMGMLMIGGGVVYMIFNVDVEKGYIIQGTGTYAE